MYTLLPDYVKLCYRFQMCLHVSGEIVGRYVKVMTSIQEKVFLGNIAENTFERPEQELYSLKSSL